MRYGWRHCQASVSFVATMHVPGSAHLFPHFPQALHTMEQVAAPQQLAAKDTSYGVDVDQRRSAVREWR